MSPPPLPGLYTDSCGTRYLARLDKKTGWWLQKQVPPSDWPAKPFQRPDFEAAANAGIFTYSPDQS